jgi:hypothetical protein
MTLASMLLSKKTRYVLERDPMSVIAIVNGIASPRKIARKIMKEIKGELGFEPKLSSVAKIVERYVSSVESSGKLAGYDVVAMKSIFAKTRVVLQSDIAVANVRIVGDTERKIARIIRYVYSKKEKPFINIIYGHTFMTIIVDQSNLKKVMQIFGKANVVYHKKNQATLSIVTPSDVMNVPGFSGYALSLLGVSGINVSEILSSYNEGLVILDEKDANKAFGILRAEIDRLRKQLRVT